MRRALPMALLLGACGAGADPPQGPEARALERVWTETFDAEFTAPPVEWREDECGGPANGVRYRDRCYAGLYLPGDRALVAWRGSYRDSAYAHELMHALQWFRGIEDPDHLRDEWKLVGQANESLAADGL